MDDQDCVMDKNDTNSKNNVNKYFCRADMHPESKKLLNQMYNRHTYHNYNKIYDEKNHYANNKHYGHYHDNNVKSAGGIVIDPWNNVNDPNKYNILIVKQRSGNNWGLPKGHCEGTEDLEVCAMREIREETGINFAQLKEGIDFVRIYSLENNNTSNKKNIKRISFFMYLLLKKGYKLKKYQQDHREIKDISWINITRLRKLCIDGHINFKCNRTLTQQSMGALNDACVSASTILKKMNITEQILETDSSSNSDSDDVLDFIDLNHSNNKRVTVNYSYNKYTHYTHYRKSSCSKHNFKKRSTTPIDVYQFDDSDEDSDNIKCNKTTYDSDSDSDEEILLQKPCQ